MRYTQYKVFLGSSIKLTLIINTKVMDSSALANREFEELLLAKNLVLIAKKV